MNNPTVTLWIITEDDGRILYAHHVATDVWLGKGKPAPTLLALYFTLKLLTEYEESLLALTMSVDTANLQQRHTIC